MDSSLLQLKLFKQVATIIAVAAFDDFAIDDDTESLEVARKWVTLPRQHVTDLHTHRVRQVAVLDDMQRVTITQLLAET